MFFGCGFLGIYYFGVVFCLKENVLVFLKWVKCYGGVSVGFFVVIVLFLDLDVSDSVEFVIRLVKRLNFLMLGFFYLSFNVVRIFCWLFERILFFNVYEFVSGRFYLLLIRIFDFKNVIVFEFFFKEDFVEVSYVL